MEQHKKVNCILLIDDDFGTNLFHSIVIEDGNFADKVVTKTNAIEALDYLKQPYNENHHQPDLIFLDINMPRMTGWEFMEEYKNLTAEQRAKNVIVMLSTSSNPDDLKKAENNPLINEYRGKPLSEEILAEVITKYCTEEVCID